ncbi:hypothetical protein [Pseudodesulfovibrio sp.]|uniref:hypothetical protein n=1 Tax=Pseudodesulfovibrio sp. TaxID=2035812 RepID=UPI002601F869|nr:hypothetical protein [Pseudodesulfovibrio sp.]MDD3313637.1 hypothetical protein [Pseudodesulfovibrio sp.]
MPTNPNQTATSRDSQLEQELNDLRRQYEQLRDQKVRAEQDMRNLTQQLDALKAQARTEYGTDDLEELQGLLETKRLENEQVVAEYRQHVQQIQADLSAVEKDAGGNRR